MFFFLTALFSSSGQTTNSSSQNIIASPNTIKIKVGKDLSCVEVADLNNDKLPDLIVSNYQDNSVTIFLGNGKGQLQEASGSPFPAGHNVNDVTIGDFNNDGQLDIVTDSWGNDKVEVHFGDSVNLFKTSGIFLKVGKRPFKDIVLPT